MSLKPAVTLSSVQAQAIVDRIASNRRVARVSELRQGEIGKVYAIELADAGPTFVFKAYPESLRWKIRKEALVARLREGRLNVPTPRIALIDEDFLVTTYLAGENLLAMESSLSPAEIASAYEQMGRAMREIHLIEMAAFGYLGADGVVQPTDSNRAYMQAQLERKVDAFAQFGDDADLARRLKAVIAERLPLLDGCAGPRLCHYDFHTGNVLTQGRGEALVVSGLLDWENAIAGDPLLDIAKTLDYSVRGDAAKRAAFLSGYGPIARSDWEATIELYEFYGMIELWAWWTQLGDHLRARTLLPALRRFASA